jgi:hypothetical protein
LEEKFRTCETKGIEASTEIQSAARKVAEENRRLRILLQERGVPNEEIDGFLGVSSAGDETSRSSASESGAEGLGNVQEAQRLEGLLAVPRPCKIGKCGPDSSSGSSPGMSTKVSTGWDSGGSSAKEYEHSPGGTSLDGFGLSYSASSHNNQQIDLSAQHPSYMAAGNIYTTDMYDGLFDTYAPLPSQPSSAYTSQLLGRSQQQLQPRPIAQQNARSYQPLLASGSPKQDRMLGQSDTYQNIVTNPEKTSCTFATNIIASMSATASVESVAAELCYGQGDDCEVDNQRVFDAMDRYTRSEI